MSRHLRSFSRFSSGSPLACRRGGSGGLPPTPTILPASAAEGHHHLNQPPNTHSPPPPQVGLMVACWVGSEPLWRLLGA
jgi:hypothetical protein